MKLKKYLILFINIIILFNVFLITISFADNEVIENDEQVEQIQNTAIESSLIEDGTYYIQSVLNLRMVLDIEGVSKLNSIGVQLWEKSPQLSDNQKFEIKNLGDGYYTIQAKHSGKVLDVKGAGTKNGTKVQQYESNGTDAQKWIIKDTKDGYVSIISKCNGLYLDVPGADATNGRKIQVYEGNDTNAQKFKLSKIKEITGEQTIENGLYKIKTAGNEKIGLDIASVATSNGANVQLWTESNVIAKNQRFIIEYQGNGFYEIKAEHSEKVLAITGGGVTNGSNVQQYEKNGSIDQKWIIKDNKDGTYSIISKKSGLYLDVTGGNIANGTNIQIYEGNGSIAQKFKFEKVEKVKCEQLLKDGIYKINTKLNSGMYLDISEGSYANIANLQIWSNSAVQQQKFRVTYNQEGYYEIKSVNSGKVLDVYGGSDRNGANVQQYQVNGTEHQKWILQDAGNGYYYIVSKGAENYLDVAGGSSNNGTNVRMYYGNQSSAQKFKFIPTNIIDNGTYEIETKLDENKVIDIVDASTENRKNAQIWDATNSKNQRFTFETVLEGTYKITAKHSNKVLTIDLNNNNVYQLEYKGDANQQWQIIEVGNGYYNIKSKSNGLVLDVSGGIATNGQNIGVYSSNGTDAQCFRMVTGFRKFYEEGVYGKSGLGYNGDGRASNLKYYKIGKGEKVFFTTFSIHGFEDSYAHDGGELTYIAEEFKKYLYNNIDENVVNNWTIYIFPNLNPDGQIYGYTQNGPGRTTLFSEAPGHKGIDMNRNWSVGYQQYKGDRNYNGTAPFQAYEAKALREFILNHQGKQNFLIDTHGWLNETIGDNELGKYYRNQYGISSHIWTYGQGYLINWARTLNNGRSLLLELPEVKNHSQTIEWGYASKYNEATMKLLKEN